MATHNNYSFWARAADGKYFKWGMLLPLADGHQQIMEYGPKGNMVVKFWVHGHKLSHAALAAPIIYFIHTTTKKCCWTSPKGFLISTALMVIFKLITQWSRWQQNYDSDYGRLDLIFTAQTAINRVAAQSDPYGMKRERYDLLL